MADPPVVEKSNKTGKSTRLAKPRACAECRRLKLRCDRNFPCQACVRRGCSALCPDKCFTEETTPSSLKASSLRSREQIQSLKERVAALEEALVAVEPSHPLLTQAESPPSVRSTSEEKDAAVEETIDIFGALSIGEDGEAVFHGATSMSEHFVQSFSGFADRESMLKGYQPVLPSSLQLLSVLCPFPPHSIAANSNINELLPYLPPASEALKLTDLYWHHFSLGNAPICRPHFTNKIYDYFYPQNTLKTHLARSDAHRLGVLFIILALGALTDLRKPMLSIEAETYHQLARASLSLDPVCDNPTIHGLQCMTSINWYLRSAPTRTSTGYRWAFNGIILKLASAIGLFRDSRKWLVDIDEIEQREVLCWEIICMEVWQAFDVGRPCSLDLTLVDCKKPPASASTSAGLPGFILGYTDWKYQFYALISEVLLVVQRPGSVKYTEILKLERQLRDCAMPDDLETPQCPKLAAPFEGLPDDAVTKHLQRFAALSIREVASCLLHRRFLVLAMQNNCDEPIRTPFYHSAYQAGHSACWIVKSHVAMYRRHPGLVSRTPAFWSMSFSAAVILGAIAARYWHREYAKGTVAPFEAICALFQEAVGTSIQPYNALEVLQRLQQRVRAQFPTSSDATRNFDDFPLLGAQPRVGKPTSEPSSSPSTTLSTVPSGFLESNGPEMALCSSLMAPHSTYEGTGMTFSTALNVGTEELPDVALWPVPDLRMSQDNNNDGTVPLLWPDGQEWIPPLPRGMSTAPLEASMPAALSLVAEVGQWNQFLDRLGVWE